MYLFSLVNEDQYVYLASLGAMGYNNNIHKDVMMNSYNCKYIERISNLDKGLLFCFKKYEYV